MFQNPKCRFFSETSQVKIRVPLSIVVGLLAAGCNIQDTGSPAAARERADMTGQVENTPSPFPEEGRANCHVAGIGREITMGRKLTIRFVKVVSDSRCPEGVLCVWAGRAFLETVVTTERGQTRIVFAVDGMNRWPPTGEIKSGTFKTLDLDGNQLTLMDLAPYPVYQQPTDPKNYRALFYLGANPPCFKAGPPGGRGH